MQDDVRAFERYLRSRYAYWIVDVAVPRELLEMERRALKIPVKEQAARMGLHRSDFYKAEKQLLPSDGLKYGKFLDYLARAIVRLAYLLPADKLYRWGFREGSRPIDTR